MFQLISETCIKAISISQTFVLFIFISYEVLGPKQNNFNQFLIQPNINPTRFLSDATARTKKKLFVCESCTYTLFQFANCLAWLHLAYSFCWDLEKFLVSVKLDHIVVNVWDCQLNWHQGQASFTDSVANSTFESGPKVARLFCQ